MNRVRDRLLIFIVAYNAENTIENVLERIPTQLLDVYEIEILIIDDSSQDKTFNRSELFRRAGLFPFNLKILFNPVNQGYGGNQKIGFHYAIENGFDWVALLHGDGQYAPECLPELIEPLATAEAEVVFGSRMIEKKQALKGGMPVYKYVGNKILTGYQNRMLHSDLSEFHSGYRLYSIAALKRIPFRLNSNDFHFDTEIIIQLIFAEQRIVELPIPTFYGNEICHVNGLRYAWDVFKATLLAKVQHFHIFYDPKYDCKAEKSAAFNNVEQKFFLEALESQDIQPQSKILLVGNVPGELQEHLRKNGHHVSVKSGSFFNEDQDVTHDIDYIFLLEDSGISLDPEKMIVKLLEITEKRPDIKICVTVANIGFILTRLLLLIGRFAYTRRGIINLNSYHFFTLRSAKKIFTQNGFTLTGLYGLPIPYGSVLSTKNLVKILAGIHMALIKLKKSLFSFQFVFFITPPPSLQHLLTTASKVSGQKSEAIGTIADADNSLQT
ncbi:MAG: glycosyltransferase family 2 protein [Desulfobulbaceae bacterium]|nr:glycosyltransferase family 2 protein [Desulfobulbaceae bacterium]